ncbi:MAG TPA: alanine racemase [Terriglobales bacterium]|nr:alanine racemase [Terriglobales bacterium]
MSFATLDVAPRQSARPTWAEISLGALCENFRTVQAHVGSSVSVCAVIKADAYGHGAIAYALALEAAGAKWFGVTTTDEGMPLRSAGLGGRILLMTGFWRGEEEEVVRQNLTATVWEPWHVELLDQAARRLDAPAQPVHLKIDTGMGRLGVALEDVASMCREIRKFSRVELEGVSTHLASSEVLDALQTDLQIKNFERAVRIVEASELTPAFYHMDNTGGVLARPDTWKNMVRPGIALYGYALPQSRAGKAEDSTRIPLKPVLSWRTRIISIREFGAGQSLGYNGTYTTTVPARIAVLPVGYADGYRRGLSNRGRVIVRDAYAPIVGNISMDLTLVDITQIAGVEEGDDVILIGSSGALTVDAAEVAGICGTVPYEILCGISKRVPRVHLP